MKPYQRAHWFWIVMLLLTLSSYLLAESVDSGLMMMFAVLAISLFKGIVIIRNFMMLRRVSIIWKMVMYSWLCAVILVIAITTILTLEGFFN
ncbi:MAG: hypothetical protein COA90_08305 [Gammaproteobacteria bacterium]|nr:MAG: hypothetical protein COA90_08305 [Gammaproteobacteria bacterium]